jgi:UDP-glucose 4-epimerase
VKDCGRAIALLQLADRLSHRTYNIASGRLTSYPDLAAAIKKTIPGARTGLPDGRDPNGPDSDVYLDLSRIRQDTGYQPEFDTERSVADHAGWLRAGHER